jgi:DNA-binding MarR family transcriptional regulator
MNLDFAVSLARSMGGRSMSSGGARSSTAEIVAAECVALRLRSLNRALTVLYDDALRPLGLRVGQLNILVAVACMRQARPVDLCRILCMDKSTLSRDVKVMQRHAWLEEGTGEDARTRLLRITPQGSDLMEKCLPAWRAAQARAKDLLGEEGTAVLLRAAGAPWQVARARPSPSKQSGTNAKAGQSGNSTVE